MKKHISILSVLLCLAIIFCSCNNGKQEQEESSTEQAVIELITDGKAHYGLVRALSMSDKASKAVGELYKEIYKATGVNIQVVTEDCSLDDGVKEIIVGSTTREESIEIAEILGENEYAIKVVGDKIVIVAKNDEILSTAIKEFMNICLSGASSGRLVIDAYLDIRVLDESYEPKVPAVYIPEGNEFVAKTKLLSELTLTNQKAIGVADSSVSVQGGCIAKGYLFTFLVVTATSEKAWVVKTNLNDPSDQTVKRIGADSTPTKYLHAHDAKYIPKKDVIYVSTGAGFEMINPDTLEELGSVKYKWSASMNGGFGFGAFGYDECNDRFYGHTSNFIYCYNGDLNDILREIPVSVSAGYKGQGGICDSKYFYSLECADNNSANKLKVYDLESGALMHIIDLGIRCETENIAYYNGSFYITCNNLNWNGRLVYKVDITAKS